MGELRDFYGDTGDNFSWMGGEESVYDEEREAEFEQWLDELYDDYFVYIFFTPRTYSAKVGMAKGRKNLELRLKERVRQCGETFLLRGFVPNGFKGKDCRQKEKEVIEWFKSHPFIKQVSTEVFEVSDPSWFRDMNIDGCFNQKDYLTLTNEIAQYL